MLTSRAFCGQWRGLVKGCVWGGLVLVLLAGSLQADAPSAISPDTIFYWLAAGISSPRIQRLAVERGLASP